MSELPIGEWRVGGSNDETHHWFLFRYIDDSSNYECRDENGNGVPRRDRSYVVYATKSAAREALRRITT